MNESAIWLGHVITIEKLIDSNLIAKSETSYAKKRDCYNPYNFF